MTKEIFLEKLEEAKMKSYNIGVCVRLEKNGTYLLLQRSSSDVWSDMYEMPGGSVNMGESLEVAARRELFEETGIVIEVDKLIPLGIFEFHNVETGSHKVKFAFSAKIDFDVKIELSPDHDRYQFLTREDIEKLPRQGKDEKYVIWNDHYRILSL